MARVTITNVEFDFSSNPEADDYYMESVEADFEGKVFVFEVDYNDVYAQDFIIETVTDKIYEESGCRVVGYDFTVVPPLKG